MKSVDPIGLARLIGTPSVFSDSGNVNPTYRGQILAPGDIMKSAFIKDLRQQELGLELLIAAVGKLLGVPIPNSYLVVSNKALPTSNGPTISTGERLLFASEDAETPSLTRFANSTPEKQKAVLEALLKLKPIDALFSFDTWIANIDRHAGNLLLGPNGLWFIDHGHALGGSGFNWSTLDPAFGYPTKLTTDLAAIMNEDRKKAVSNQCQAFPSEAKNLACKNIIGVDLIKAVLGVADFDLASNFLEQRKAHVPKLGSSIVGIGILA